MRSDLVRNVPKQTEALLINGDMMLKTCKIDFYTLRYADMETCISHASFL